MTPQEAKQKLIESGVTAAEYARRNGFKYTQVIAVLNGTNKGRYGEAHRIAVALGLKQGEAT
ncbi:DNA-binding protein [Methylomonas rapida]|uniref:DNA-binding protein n=1 Tax=Methylomonas rapida TaxID=2963939 RepID=A0ABY7GK36_9GAMM|nr:DNA-binding protein [Methylomonas rapida]WAR43618.1 DNA-binding protein [Methylomonas rapida]